MADIICCDQTTTTTSSSSCGDHHHHQRRSRRSRMDHNIRNSSMFKFVPDHHVVAESSSSSVLVPALVKRQKLDMIISTSTTQSILLKPCLDSNESSMKKIDDSFSLGYSETAPPVVVLEHEEKLDQCPKFSTTSVCGRRREMEDAVAIHPSFWRKDGQRFHFFGVYDGHGCSHVAKNCKKRLHHLVREELDREKINNNHREEEYYWKEVMERSFDRMDKEVLQQNITGGIQSLMSCKCELQMPQCDAVGSTAVVSIVTPDKVVVANCGDSRAILCRDGKAVPLSVDHKPDLPEELKRIEEAGGRVIYWDGARVLGVLAMSRAIGDNYLKPYVSSVPEITVTERSEEDEFLIMASDGLWDVVSNDTACDIVKMCLNGNSPIMPEKSSPSPVKDGGKMFGEEKKDKGCSDAVMLLTKLALARRSGDNVSVVVVDLRREKKKKN